MVTTHLYYPGFYGTGGPEHIAGTGGVSRDIFVLYCVRIADGAPLFPVVYHAAVLCDADALLGLGGIGSEIG